MPATGPTEAARLLLGMLCEQESVAGDWYLWFPWQPPSDWKEPECGDGNHWERLCDSPISRQKTAKKLPPVKLWGGWGGRGKQHSCLSFHQLAKVLGGNIDFREIAGNGGLLRRQSVRKLFSSIESIDVFQVVSFCSTRSEGVRQRYPQEFSDSCTDVSPEF